MFRRAFRRAVAAGPARTHAGHGAPWTVAVASGAAATAALATVSPAPRRPPAACEGFDWVSAGVGGLVVGAGVYVLRNRGSSKAEVSFEDRLKSAYNKNATARAVLANTPRAHPDLVKLAVSEEGQDIKDTGLAVANYIREIWAEILSEAFHFPKSFFIATRTPGKLTGQMVGDDRRTPISQGIGTYKVSIPLLKDNKRARELGVDRLAEAFDRNGDGVLDFHEFATMMLFQADFAAESQGHQKRTKAAILQLLYAVLDDNGDGRVTRDEFESFMVMAARLGITSELDAAQHCKYWKEFDKDGNNLMSYDEFVAFAGKVLDLSQFPGEFPKAI